jgi:hypothetical protein
MMRPLPHHFGTCNADPRKYAKLVPGDVLSPADFFSIRRAREKKLTRVVFLSVFYLAQGFYLYLYFGSMLFLLCMYATVLRPKPSAAAKKSKSKYTLFYSARSWVKFIVICYCRPGQDARVHAALPDR